MKVTVCSHHSKNMFLWHSLIQSPSLEVFPRIVKRWDSRLPPLWVDANLHPLRSCCSLLTTGGKDRGLNISLILVFTVLMGCLALASLLFLDRNSLAAAGRTMEEHVPQQLFSNTWTFTWRWYKKLCTPALGRTPLTSLLLEMQVERSPWDSSALF